MVERIEGTNCNKNRRLEFIQAYLSEITKNKIESSAVNDTNGLIRKIFDMFAKEREKHAELSKKQSHNAAKSGDKHGVGLTTDNSRVSTVQSVAFSAFQSISSIY